VKVATTVTASLTELSVSLTRELFFLILHIIDALAACFIHILNLEKYEDYYSARQRRLLRNRRTKDSSDLSRFKCEQQSCNLANMIDSKLEQLSNKFAKDEGSTTKVDKFWMVYSGQLPPATSLHKKKPTTAMTSLKTLPEDARSQVSTSIMKDEDLNKIRQLVKD